MKDKCLIVTATPRHYLIVEPLIMALRSRNWPVTVLRFEKIWKYAEWFYTLKHRITIEDFYHPKASQGRYMFLKRLLARLAEFAVNMIKPKITVVMTEGILPCQIFVEASRTHHIPVLLYFQTGFLGRYYDKKPEFSATKIAISANYMKDALVQRGIDEKRIVVTGQPLYDWLRWKTILYCTDGYPKTESVKYATYICKAIKQLSWVRLVIKPHPHDAFKHEYEQIIRNYHIDAKVVDKKSEIFKLLREADLILTGYSTVALDAMLIGKRIVTFNFSGNPDPLAYAEMGATFGVTDPNELKNALYSVLCDESIQTSLDLNMKRFVREHVDDLDGHSGERVVDMIDRMISDNEMEEWFASKRGFYEYQY